LLGAPASDVQHVAGNIDADDFGLRRVLGKGKPGSYTDFEQGVRLERAGCLGEGPSSWFEYRAEYAVIEGSIKTIGADDIVYGDLFHTVGFLIVKM
jgi:hypothetical protein